MSHTTCHSDFNRALKIESLEGRLLLAGDLTFAASASYPTGVFSIAISSGDFDADGDLDLVIANCACGEGKLGDISVLLNHGDGTFAAETRYDAGRHPGDVVVGDFDGDSDLDLAVTGYDSRVVSLLMGAGDGTFPDATSVNTRGAEGGAAADVDGDGDLDLVSGNDVSRAMVVLNNGRVEDEWAGFAEPVGYPTTQHPKTLSFEDFDGDGILDLLVIARGARSDGFPGGADVLLGNGDGTFQAKQTFEVDRHSVRHDLGDINGDGATDMVVQTETARSQA